MKSADVRAFHGSGQGQADGEDFFSEKGKQKMSDEMKKNEAAQAENKAQAQSIMDPEEQLRMFGRGKMELARPILAGGKDVTALQFDFTALTGREMVAALDKDGGASMNAFRISDTQAFNLFAAAAGKATEGIDATDIRERMSAIDSVKAVQLATVFFSAANRAGNRRISNE